MFKIINKVKLAGQITKLDIEAPLIANKAQAGQFVVVINDEKGERIPLTLADWDASKGKITLIFQEVGFSTSKLAAKNTGDSIAHILGPLGQPAQVKDFSLKGSPLSNSAPGNSKTSRKIICVGGGVGIAEAFPISRAFKDEGLSVVGIVGARNKELLILEDKMREACSELYIATDNGSYGQKGFVTDILKAIFLEKAGLKYREEKGDPPGQDAEWQIDLVYAVGPVAMMRAVCEFTRRFKIKTIVNLNPIMVDATGMCGACRCTVGNKIKFACVEGTDFDGHLVDFQELEKRLNQFKTQEQQLLD
ncbi:MAG: sulfide/dihydroorotate dehydrogenase-like FAD/NAD-binding protein [Candidatus Omnitrophota bacterium]